MLGKFQMKNSIISALLISIALVLCTAIWVYFSPYQTCVRNYEGPYAEYQCAKILGRAAR